MPVSAIEVYQGVLAELKHYNTTSMTPDEFNYHAWVSLLEWVKNKYWATDAHQSQMDDLDIIKVVTDGVAGSPSPIPNADVSGDAALAFIDLPDDYLHLLAVGVKVKYKNVPCETDDTESNYVSATNLKEDERFAIGNDYYAKPEAVWPTIYYNQRNRKLTFNTGDSLLLDCIISYYRYPVRIFFDVNDPTGGTACEFEWEQVMEIIKYITASYLETTSNPRWQTMTAEQQKHFKQYPMPNQPI